jgi:hypothetical protein
MLPFKRDPAAFDDPSPAERRWLDELQRFPRQEAGYQAIQGTRP